MYATSAQRRVCKKAPKVAPQTVEAPPEQAKPEATQPQESFVAPATSQSQIGDTNMTR